nr:hypothetical protein [Tanacetum cinerariifolium]
MSNTNNDLQSQISNALHNVIMEAGDKDHPPMLALALKTPTTPGNDGDALTRPERVKEGYAIVPKDINNKLIAEVEAIQIILIRIDNDIYFIVDVCLNAMEMDDTNDEHEDQELEAHYMYMSKIQEDVPEFFEINELKAQLQDKNVAIRELKKFIAKLKGKSIGTKFVKPSVSRQPNAFKFQKSSAADSGCSKHMTGNLKLLVNFMEKFLDESVTMSLNELDMLFRPMFDEYFNGATPVVSKSSDVPTTDESDKRQQQNTTPSTSTIVAADIP